MADGLVKTKGLKRVGRFFQNRLFQGLALAAVAIVPAMAEDYLSPLALAAGKDGAALYVAEGTAKQIAVIDVAKAAVSKTIAVPEPISGLALAPDGARLYVTIPLPSGLVCVLNLANGAVEASIPVGHTPVAPVVSPDGATLYVCNRFNNDVGVIDLAAKAVTARIPVMREPVTAAVTPDGKLLFVGNHLPVGPADGDSISTSVSVIDAAARQVTATIVLPNGCTSLRSLCLSPDGQYVYVAHYLGRYQLPTTQLERGWMNTNALSVIDVAARKLVNTVLLDDVDLGAANPWGVACSPDGKYICVAHGGTHEVSVIDRAGLHDKLAKVAAGERVSEVSASPVDVPNDLSFLVGLRRRLAVTGLGPRAVAVIGTNAYVAEYFSDSVGILDIRPEARPNPRSIALGPTQPMTAVRRGELLFNDARLCFQQWQSCSSCHPDSRADSLNWDLLNDGMGNPKNTKNMLLVDQTPPAMSAGVREDAAEAVRAGIRHVLFSVRPEEDAAAILKYLKSMKPVPSPFLVNGELSEAAKRGKETFTKAGCTDCHPGPLYTDLKAYNVRTGKGMDEGKPLDTPTLVEVWRTAPYLHDGRAATMKELLTTYNPGDKHGRTSGLSPQELDHLIQFILSL